MSILDYFVTSFAEVGFAINLICHIASFWGLGQLFDDTALSLMKCFELEAIIEL